MPNALAHTRWTLGARQPLSVLFFGDSICNGIGASHPRLGFPIRLVESLREQYEAPIRMANLSAGGRTTAEGRALVEDACLGTFPDLAIVAFGVNDQKPVRRRLGRGRFRTREEAVPPDEFEEHIAAIAHTLKVRSGADVILVSPGVIPPHCGRVSEYADALRRVAVRQGYALADVTSVWLGSTERLVAEDGAHPNDRGHELYLKTLLALNF